MVSLWGGGKILPPPPYYLIVPWIWGYLYMGESKLKAFMTKIGKAIRNAVRIAIEKKWES